MSEREKILGRIREALMVEAPFPGGHNVRGPHVPVPTVPSPRKWLPKPGESRNEWIELFTKNAAELKADFQFLNSAEEVRRTLEQMRDKAQWKKAACHDGGLTDLVCPALGIPLLRTNINYDVAALEACDVGISECDALVAQTGTVIVTNASAGGRALSVLPPHHVVLAKKEQLVPDLSAAIDLLKKKYAPKYPSMISFITGPSRTGDIERILVLGAHGPKRLTILCF